MSIQDILKAATAALFALWAIYTEFRLRRAQDANEIMRRSLNDQKITDAIKAMPDSDLKSELSKDIG